MESKNFDLREWCREQVKLSGIPYNEIARISGFTPKTISYMMTHHSGSLDAWQRVLNALPHINRYTLPDTPLLVLKQCDEWDKMSKGESPTTATIRRIIRKGLRLT